MDQRFLHHSHYHQHQQQPQQQRTRYSPLTPQSHHHHHNNLPPPPPPPRPPLSYRTIDTPPRPPFNTPLPHQSPQFPIYPHRPIEEERPLTSSSSNHHHHLLPRRIVPGPPWNPNPEDRPTRNYPPRDFDRESYHHHRPPPPPPLSHPPIGYDQDAGYRELKVNRLEGNPRETLVSGRNTADVGYHRHAPNQARDDIPQSKTGGYGRAMYGVECNPEISTRVGSRRWVSDRKDSSCLEFVNDEITVPLKREYHSSEIVRYNNSNNSSISNSNNFRGNSNREGVHGFNRTPPKKQIQKKSALLRIKTVKPNHHRNRDVEQQLRYGVPDFRGKDQQHQHGYFSSHGHSVKAEEERKGSPVELDISFESNSLVAKAIVAAPSTSGVPLVSDANLENSKKVSASDADSEGSQLSKLSSGGVNLVDDNDKALEKNVGDTKSQPCASATGNPHEVAVAVKASGLSFDKSTPKVVKKKRIVKRVVKKGSVNSNSTTVSSLPLANVDGGTMQADSVTLSSSTAACDPVIAETFLEEKSTDVNKVSEPDCSHSLPNEGNVLAENEKGCLSLHSSGLACRSQECKIDEDSDFGKESRFERGGSISYSPSRASSSEDKNSGSPCLDACNSVHDSLSMTSIDNVNKSLNGSTSEINHTDCENMQLCQSEVSLSLGKYTDVGCSKNRNPVDVGDEMNDIVVSTDIINTQNSAYGSVCAFNFNDLSVSERDFTVNESKNNDIVGKAYCENIVPTITQYAILEENSDAAIPLQSSGVVFSSSTNTRIRDGHDCLQNTSVLKQGSDNGSSDLDDSIILHDFGIMKDAVKVSPSEVTIFPEICDTDKTLPNSNFSVGSDERDTSKIKKGNVRTYLSLSSSNMDDISPDRVYPISHENDSDRGSSQLLNDPCHSEVLNHSLQRLNFDSQSNLDRDTSLHGRRGDLEAEFYVGNNDNDDPNKVSPVSKREKVAANSQSEFTNAIVATTSNVEVPISFNDNKAHQDDDAMLSSMVTLSTQQSMPYSGDIAKLSDSILTGGSFQCMDTSRETISSEHLELQHSDMVTTPCEDLAFPNVQFPVLGCEQQENIIPVVPVSNTQTYILDIGNIKGGKTDSQVVENSYHCRDFEQRSPRADMESNDVIMKDDSLAEKNLLSCPTDGEGVTTRNSNDELIEDSHDALSDIYSQGMPSELPDRTIIEFTAIRDENICGHEENLNNISMIKHGSDLHALTSSIQHTEKPMKSDHAIGCSDSLLRNILPEPTQVDSKDTTQDLNSHCSELNGSKNQPDGVILKNSQGHSFAFPKSKTKTSASSIQSSKSRTWHRTGNNNPPTSLHRIKPSAGTVPPKRPIIERNEKFQNTSYIRKGNSLVRKANPVSAKPQISSINQLPLGLDEIPKSTRPESRAAMTDQPIYLKKAVSNAPRQRQSTPPLAIDTKSEDSISPPLVEPPSSDFCENASTLRKFNETNDASDSYADVLKQYETPENQTGPSNNGESQIEANDGNTLPLNSKRIVYMKPKTNQLIATSNSCDIIVSADDKGQTAFSDGYFKRSKNQLVRTTFESHLNQTMPNNIVKCDGQGTGKGLCNRRFTKRRSHKVLLKSSRASLVWTLRSKNSSGNDRDSWHYQKVLPHLFPWKRAMYLRSFIHNSASSFNGGSSSAVSKNLLPLRKRDTVYTKSTRGFSLWKSKVLGIGGSSLKWSKSIEKHSKKANEEATLAVAAVERKKREQKGSQAKRERIFRIGSVRYRMDPSRRTLQRISEDESPSSASTSSGLAAKRAYIPRRLVIGNDEYVRIGNGNQLIRDPKKRTRKLANEKVRWSLHTARQRLARKQKYCQFFTRFGKCNKDGGKCPYIHDPSKIAVCTKFLNGLCSTSNCKLTHKVIPERMPDCSYFLQGLCSNRNCPYRHVNVNPKASICDGFLKGYCADGNECRNKHSYVCPSFEATGTCAQGTKCKLHHPKKQSKGKKRKRFEDQNNSCSRRYFGSIPVDVSEPGVMVPPRHHQQNEELENELTDYISLDVNGEAADTVDHSFELSTFCDADTVDLNLDTSDELIKPVSLITKFSLQSQSSSLQA